MRRNRTKYAHPAFTSRPWRVQFEQSPLSGAWVYKFPIAESDGHWIELPGKVRSAYRTIGGGVVQYIQETPGFSGKMWRALLEVLEHTRAMPIDGVFEGVLFSANGRLRIRLLWSDDENAVAIDSINEAALHSACRSMAGYQGVPARTSRARQS